VCRPSLVRSDPSIRMYRVLSPARSRLWRVSDRAVRLLPMTGAREVRRILLVGFPVPLMDRARLLEFVRQILGEPPVGWRDYSAAAS